MGVYLADPKMFSSYTNWKDTKPASIPLDDELHWFPIVLPRSDEVIIIPMSDLHYGNRLFSPGHLFHTIDYVAKHKNVYVVLNGDLCESATKSSPGAIFDQTVNVQDQRDWIIEQFKPISKRILAVTTGNHEERIYKDVGLDLSKDIASAFGCPYRSSGIMLRMDLNGIDYWLYMSHGYGGARTRGGKTVKLERTATFIHADIYIMSHDHMVNAEPDIYMAPDEDSLVKGEDGMMSGTMKAHRKMLVKSNAYMKWGGYSESKGYSPVDMEVPLIKLSGHTKRVRVEI